MESKNNKNNSNNNSNNNTHEDLPLFVVDVEQNHDLLQKKKPKIRRTASWFAKRVKNRLITRQEKSASSRRLLIEIPETDMNHNSSGTRPKAKSLMKTKAQSLTEPPSRNNTRSDLEQMTAVTRNSHEIILVKEIVFHNYPALPKIIQEDIKKFSMATYTSNYFQEFQKNKPNVFNSKNDPTKKILQHSKTELKETILICQPQVQEKALEIFNKILCYMGDKMTTKSITDFTVNIISDTIAIPQLRDEVYCQLVKQTTNNPSLASEEKGWELFSVLLETILPTQDFEFYIKSYFAKSIQETENRIRQIALSCYNRLDELSKGAPRVPKVPSQEQIKYYKELPFLSSSFHVTLEELMLRQNSEELKIPIVLQSLTEAIKKNNGFLQPNIFRNASSASETFALKLDLEYHGGLFSEPPDNNYVIANTLKLWLKEIRTPIIPPEIYPHIIKHSTHLPTLREIIDNNLPPHNKNVLIYIVKFLQNLAEFKENNKMTEEGLSVVISPSLCRCPEQNPIKAAEYTKDESLFVMTLITDWKEL